MTRVPLSPTTPAALTPMGELYELDPDAFWKLLDAPTDADDDYKDKDYAAKNPLRSGVRP